MKARFIIPAVLIGAAFYVIAKVLHIQNAREHANGPDAAILLAYDSYRQQLASFRATFMAADMTYCPFFLSGMGNRTKLIYKNEILRNALTGDILKQWPLTEGVILPNHDMVRLQTSKGDMVIYENEDGVFIREGDDVEQVPG